VHVGADAAAGAEEGTTDSPVTNVVRETPAAIKERVVTTRP
jgi:hypothetical protein